MTRSSTVPALRECESGFTHMELISFICDILPRQRPPHPNERRLLWWEVPLCFLSKHNVYLRLVVAGRLPFIGAEATVVKTSEECSWNLAAVVGKIIHSFRSDVESLYFICHQ